MIETPGDISQLTMGKTMTSMSGMGSTGGMESRIHLHIVVDGTGYMPAADQMTKIGPSRYEYHLPKLAAGTHTIKVFWASDTTHAVVDTVETATCKVLG